MLRLKILRNVIAIRKIEIFFYITLSSSAKKIKIEKKP